MASKALIIPAAGSGSRMQKDTPKPYLKLSGATILGHTIRRFLSIDGLRQIVVATSEEYLERAEGILEDLLPATVTGCCIVGGSERQYSIYNALAKLPDVDLVMVHDAVRPCVKKQHIEQCCDAAVEIGAAVLGIPAKDTIKRVDKQQIIQETPTRKFLWQTQTPQVFQRDIIVEAYQRASEDNFTGTDDSSLVERLGYPVKMVKGDQSNIKITYPLDLTLAELIIERQQGA